MHIRSTEPMAQRRVIVEINRAIAEADRKARPWRRLTGACLALASVAFPCALVATVAGQPTAGAVCFAVCVLSLLGAEIAADKAAR
jgi:hypothetical protein